MGHVNHLPVKENHVLVILIRGSDDSLGVIILTTPEVTAAGVVQMGLNKFKTSFPQCE